MKSLITLLKTVKTQFLFSTLVGAIAGLGNAGLLMLLNYAISKQLLISTPTILTYFILLVIVFFAESKSQALFTCLSQGVIFDMQIKLCRQILSAPLRQLEILGTPKLSSALTQDINILGITILTLPLFFINCVIVIGCFIYMSIISIKIFFTVLIFSLSSFFVFLIIDINIVKKRFENARKVTDELFHGFQALVNGIKELKINYDKREAFFKNKIIAPSIQYRNDITAAMSVYAIGQSGWKISFFILLGFLLFVLPHFGTVTTSSLEHAIIVIFFLMSPLSSIITFFPNIRRSLIALHKIRSLRLTPEQFITDKKNQTTLMKKNGSQHKLVLNDITHSYQNENTDVTFMLGPINMAFNLGEVVFLVGQNGSGKSTLAKLITGLYKQESGYINLNNTRIDSTNIEWYQQHFSTVFSDYFLFDKLYGLNSHNIKDKVKQYLILLQLDHKVVLEKNGFSTTQLSEGQRKRLALLVSYLEDRDIYVFDEWASNQDPLFKEVFYTQLIPDLKNNNKCVIVISHDEKYFHTADRILILENGNLKLNESNTNSILQ